MFPQASAAMAAALSPEQTATYRSKLEQAEASRSILASLSECLSAYLVNLQARSAESEQALADALRRQSDLTNQVSQTSERLKGFENLTKSEMDKVLDRRRQYNDALSEQREQAARLRTCNQVLFLLPGICKAGEDAVKGFGWMRDAEAELRAQEGRLQSTEAGLRQMQQQLEGNQQQLSRAQQDFTANQAAIMEIEGRISKAKSAGATINIKLQDYNILHGTLADTIKQAATLNPDDVRIRQVDRLSSELDALTAGTPAFITSTEQSLPDDAKQKCSR